MTEVYEVGHQMLVACWLQAGVAQQIVQLRIGAGEIQHFLRRTVTQEIVDDSHVTPPRREQ